MKIMVSCEHSGTVIPPELKNIIGEIEHLDTYETYEYGSRWLFDAIAPRIGDYYNAFAISPIVVDADGSISNGTALTEHTSKLSAQQAGQIIRDYYLPYFVGFEEKAENWNSENEKMLIVSIHTFQPIVRNLPIGMDLGLIFDHNNSEERSLALRIKRAFEKNASWVRVKFNAPHKVKEDGFVNHMREMYGNNILGLEIEAGQNMVYPVGLNKIADIICSTIEKWRIEQ